MQCIAGIMKMCSPLVTHQRWLGLLLLLLCVGYSHGMPHVLRFEKIHDVEWDDMEMGKLNERYCLLHVSSHSPSLH